MSRAEPRLDPADGFRDGGFENIQRSRRPGEGANLNALAEDRQPLEVRQVGHGDRTETMSFEGFYF